MGSWGNGTNTTLFYGSANGIVWVQFHDKISTGKSTSLSIHDTGTGECLSADMGIEEWKNLRKDIDEAIAFLEGEDE